MDFKTMKTAQLSKSKGIPEQYADRELLEAQKIRSTFKNDAPVVLVTKPKYEKDKNTGEFIRVLSRKGNKVMKTVAYIPIEMGGKKYIVATTTDENIDLLKTLVDEKDGKVIKPAEDIYEQTVEFTATELIEGDLRFVLQPKSYANGSVYDVAVLDLVE